MSETRVVLERGEVDLDVLTLPDLPRAVTELLAAAGNPCTVKPFDSRRPFAR
jgi:hypothetical protein